MADTENMAIRLIVVMPWWANTAIRAAAICMRLGIKIDPMKVVKLICSHLKVREQ